MACPQLFPVVPDTDVFLPVHKRKQVEDEKRTKGTEQEAKRKSQPGRVRHRPKLQRQWEEHVFAVAGSSAKVKELDGLDSRMLVAVRRFQCCMPQTTLVPVFGYTRASSSNSRSSGSNKSGNCSSDGDSSGASSIGRIGGSSSPIPFGTAEDALGDVTIGGNEHSSRPKNPKTPDSPLQKLQFARRVFRTTTRANNSILPSSSSSDAVVDTDMPVPFDTDGPIRPQLLLSPLVAKDQKEGNMPVELVGVPRWATAVAALELGQDHMNAILKQRLPGQEPEQRLKRPQQLAVGGAIRLLVPVK